MTTFIETLKKHNIRLTREKVVTLQVNIGKRCNQSCSHCHVESSPTRTENMDEKTIDRLIALLEKAPHIQLVDITGGAPELNPHFRRFVTAIRGMGKGVIDRCNLTVLFEPGQEDTAEFLAQNQVEIVASLPCYLEDNVDKQRGKGVFGKSIRALEILNQLGYGKENSGLILNLVYNPTGPHLPPSQDSLERDYKHYLQEKFGLTFNNLFTITNMPIKRYFDYLKRLHKLDEYQRLLQTNFNVNAAQHVMCNSLISIGWDGNIYDCDFNQMLDIPLNYKPLTIWDIDIFDECIGPIAVADHCFGCTAGAGSSCGGVIT